MKISQSTNDEAVLEELGQRIQRLRLQSNITQADLAREAGISTPTLQRFESGSSVQLSTLIRVLRALELLERLEVLIRPPEVRPMALLDQKTPRRRASPGASKDVPAWEWGD